MSWCLALVPLILSAGPQMGPLDAGAERVYFRRDGSLMVFDLVREDLRTLWPARSPEDTDPPAVSRDGRTVYFSQAGNIWALERSAPMPARLTTLGRPRDEVGTHCDLPLPSPDGAWLAYRARTGAGDELRLLDLTSGEDRALARVDAWEVCWAPDGSLVYTADQRLWRRQPPGSEPRPVTTDPAAALPHSAPHYAADGQLYFVAAGQPQVLWPDGRLEPAGATDGATRLLPGPRAWPLAIERKLVEPERTWTEVALVTADAAAPRTLVTTAVTKGHGGHVAPLGWLADGRLLVVRDFAASDRKLYAVDPATAKGALVFHAQDRDSGFVLWHAPAPATSPTRVGLGG